MAKKAQIDKFREKACELEADADEGRFDEALKRVAKHKPSGEDGAPKAPKPTKPVR